MNQPPWPRAWLMTDERLGDRLWDVVELLPRGAGIVFRHYSLGAEDRLQTGRRLVLRARERRLVVAVAGSNSLAERLDVPLVHNPDEPGSLPCTMAVHDENQALAAQAAGAVLAFVGPIFPTSSHPGALAIGQAKAASLARLAGCPAIALGGMNKQRFDDLQREQPQIFHGYAGIDCWVE